MKSSTLLAEPLGLAVFDDRVHFQVIVADLVTVMIFLKSSEIIGATLHLASMRLTLLPLTIPTSCLRKELRCKVVVKGRVLFGF